MIETPYCPTCGKPTTFRESPEWLLGHWTGRYTNMLAGLIDARRKKRGTSIDELIELAYIDRQGPTDMPTYPESSIRVLLVNNEAKLNKLGWTIMGPRKTGNGFWLVPLEID